MLEFLKVELEAVVIGFEDAVISLQLLGLPPGAAVLEPNGHLSRLQAEFLSKLHFPLWLELVLNLEVLLQCLDLVNAQSPLLLRNMPTFLNTTTLLVQSLQHGLKIPRVNWVVVLIYNRGEEFS